MLTVTHIRGYNLLTLTGLLLPRRHSRGHAAWGGGLAVIIPRRAGLQRQSGRRVLWHRGGKLHRGAHLSKTPFDALQLRFEDVVLVLVECSTY